MSLLSFLSSTVLSFFVNKFLSHPDSKINKRLPTLKFKAIQVSPHIKIHFKNRYIHFHHWFNFSILLIISFTIGGSFLEAWSTKGLLVGGILQGITYADWKQLIKPQIEPKA